jgi:hypothetical protein
MQFKNKYLTDTKSDILCQNKVRRKIFAVSKDKYVNIENKYLKDQFGRKKYHTRKINIGKKGK